MNIRNMDAASLRGQFLPKGGLSIYTLLVAALVTFARPACGQIGSIDAPQFEDVVSGQWVFTGWTMDSTAPVTNVEILVDGTDYGPSTYGGNRADACNAIGNYPGCPNVGWTILFDTTQLVDGPHLLTVVTTASNGQQSSMIRAFIVDNAGQGLNGTTYYKIVSRATGSVLDVTNVGLTAGATIQEWQYLGGPNQLWTVIPTDDGHWTFESLNSLKVLTVPFGQSANGTVIEQFQDYLSSEQEWSMVAAGDGSYALFNVATGRSLDLTESNPANGTAIQIYDYLGGLNQNWLLVPVLSPPSGLFGYGGADNYSSNPPQIDPSDILFDSETSNMATQFASGANGPACDPPGELAALPVASGQAGSDGLTYVPYAYTNAPGNRKVTPDPAVKIAFDNAFGDWNGYDTTTGVYFQPLGSSPLSYNTLGVANTNNEKSGYCAQWDPTTSVGGVIDYGGNFVQVARANVNAQRPTIPEGEAAHEIGHYLGMTEAGTNPGTPTVMNQAYNPNGLAAACANPMGAPQRQPTYLDATTVNSCINQGRNTVQQGSYGGISVAYSTITYYPPGCTDIFNTITWLLDDSFSGYGYPIAVGWCTP